MPQEQTDRVYRAFAEMFEAFEGEPPSITPLQETAFKKFISTLIEVLKDR